MPNKNTVCLNCGAELSGEFCTACGQASATARMSFSRMFSEEFLTSIVELNSGFLRACIDLIVRPGDLIKNYLAGQRKHYFHFAGLLLILLTIDAVLLSFAVNSELSILNREAQGEADAVNIFNPKGYERMYDYYKFILALVTPLIALAPYFLFKKIAYFYSEHIVIAWFYLSLGILLSIVLRLLGMLPLDLSLYESILFFSAVVSLGLSLRFYWGLSRIGEYALWSRTLRVATVSIVNMLISALVPALMTWQFTV